MEELRDQLTQEKDKSLVRERELAQQKFDRQLDEEMKVGPSGVAWSLIWILSFRYSYLIFLLPLLLSLQALETQRRRLYAEAQEEKTRLAEQAARQRAELDRIQVKLEETHRKTASAIAEDYEKAKEEEEEKHRRELKELKERLEIEKTAWMENIMKKQESVLSAKERELKEKVRKERDEEIEAVITRLEEDMTSSKEDAERAAENRVKRLKDKFEAEARELESSEKAALEKYNEMKTRLLDVESNAEGKRLDE